MKAPVSLWAKGGPPWVGLLALLVSAVTPGPASAQAVEGTVAGATQRVLVRLLGGDEGVVGQVTDPTGRFLLAVPAPGSYRLQVERPGYRPLRSGPVEVEAGGRRHGELALPTEALALSEAPDPAPAQCGPRPGEIDRLTLAWHSARTALAMTVWNENRGELLLDATLHRRQLEPDGRTVVRSEAPVERSGVSRLVPAVNAPDLLSRGFIREDPDGDIRYFPPTAAVLVDPGFLDRHCLRLQGPSDGPLLGVAFEPREAPEGVDPRPGVAGVIWLNAVDGRPVLVEFAYRNVDARVVPASAGGRTVFGELPDGSWVTVESWLRVPLLQRGGAQSGEWQVAGLQEERARLLRVRSSQEAWSVTPEVGTLRGRVLASSGGAPLEGARVRLAGTPHEARSDPQGRFRVSGLLDGVYRVTVSHPSFDDLLLGPEVQSVSVRPGETSVTTLAPPSLSEAATRLCSTSAGVPSSVIVTGQVRDSLSGEPLVGMPLNIRYRDPRREGRPDRTSRVSSGAGGYYVYCDVPRGETVRIRAEVPGANSDDDRTFLALGPVEHQDLRVALSTEQGVSGVFGVIRDAGSGNPVEAAEVLIQGGPRPAITNSNGFFSIPGVEPGLHVVEVRHLGYASREVVVRVDGGQAYQVDVTLEVDAIPLEGITVSVVPSRLYGDMVDMQRRMEMGFGDYLLRRDMERRPGTLDNALQGLAGVRVVTGTRLGERFLVLRDRLDLVQEPVVSDGTDRNAPATVSNLRYCYPAVWLDGRRWSRPTAGGVGHDPVDFTQFVTMDIEAVEIYRGAASVPGEFGGGDAACGAVIIWTRRGGRTIRGDVGGSDAFQD